VEASDGHPSTQPQLTRHVSTNGAPPAKKKKATVGFFEGLRFLAQDRYILCIAVLVIAYGVSINLVEVTWKNQLKHAYTNPSDYVTFMGYYSSCTGILTLLMMMFVGGNMVRRLGWGFTAQFTPWVLLITGAIFFILIVVKGLCGGGHLFLLAAVYVGALQNVLSKASKYSLFDPTKEMAYIPLDNERKVKGKAAIDGVGSRLGKSGGSIIYQALLVLGGTLDNVTPYVAVILAAVIGGWIYAAASLEPKFEEMSGNGDFKQRRGSTLLRRFSFV
jgi:AAA family ATP:ADP antiporter